MIWRVLVFFSDESTLHMFTRLFLWVTCTLTWICTFFFGEREIVLQTYQAGIALSHLREAVADGLPWSPAAAQMQYYKEDRVTFKFHSPICAILSPLFKGNSVCSYSSLSLVTSILSLLSLPLTPCLASKILKMLLLINERALVLIRAFGNSTGSNPFRCIQLKIWN